jgi:hypothetical protein
MADEKKYSAQEAAIAVLAKAEQMLKNSSLMKAQKLEKVLGGVGSPSTPVGRPDMGSGAIIVRSEDAEKENEIGTKFQKAENKTAPSNSQKPRIEEKPTERDYKNFETQPGNAPENDHRQAEQTPPGKNPHEKAEGNNPDWGTDPGVKGHIKLAHFIGHRSAKKKQQQSASGTVPAQGANLEKHAGDGDDGKVIPGMKKGIALS